MVGRFGSREICDVTFKANQEGQRIGNKTFHKGQPVFVIDTATASSMEQATTTVYAQGGRGYNRLISWEGEKTVTFSVTDALISPLGLAMLTGAGLADASATDLKHIHMTYDIALNDNGEATLDLDQLNEELGIDAKSLNICDETKFKPYATELDSNGGIVGWVDASAIAITSDAAPAYAGTILVNEENAAKVTVEGLKNKTIKLDFYVAMTEKATQVTIAPDSFGGTFYVEADTLYRNQNGQDMAATLTFPKAKIQSGFTLAMAPTGDPSTFDFTMDAMPGYTYFDSTKKVVCDIVIVGEDTNTDDEGGHEPHTEKDYSISLSDVDDSDVLGGGDSIKYTVTLGADATGFTADVKVNGVADTPSISGKDITISGLVSTDVVNIVVKSKEDPTKTDSDSYTVA